MQQARPAAMSTLAWPHPYDQLGSRLAFSAEWRRNQRSFLSTTIKKGQDERLGYVANANT